MTNCKRCGRILRSQNSIVNGMGRQCKKKASQEEADAEFLKMQMTIFDPEFSCVGGIEDARQMYTST